MNRPARLVIGVLTVGVVVIGGAVGYGLWALGGAAGEGEQVLVRVEEGMTAGGVAERLVEEDVVRSGLAFRLKARSRGLDHQLQAGRYEFATGMSVDEAIDVLLAGPLAPPSSVFTIPEGLTVAETLERLAAQTPHTVDDYRRVLAADVLSVPDWVPPLTSFPAGVRQPYEGLLFPETYRMLTDAPPAAILQRMVDQLTEVMKTVPERLIRQAPSRGLDRYETLVLASLVEEEAKIAGERQTIAGVIANRLTAGRQLEIDATVIYATGRRGRVVQDELAVDSPYNTYRQPGLPPTPISAPGAAAIRAAFDPTEHNYLYYAKVDEQGRHCFSRTLAEHQQRCVPQLRQLQRTARTGGPPNPSPARETPVPDGS